MRLRKVKKRAIRSCNVHGLVRSDHEMCGAYKGDNRLYAIWPICVNLLILILGIDIDCTL